MPMAFFDFSKDCRKMRSFNQDQWYTVMQLKCSIAKRTKTNTTNENPAFNWTYGLNSWVANSFRKKGVMQEGRDFSINWLTQSSLGPMIKFFITCPGGVTSSSPLEVKSGRLSKTGGHAWLILEADDCHFGHNGSVWNWNVLFIETKSCSWRDTTLRSSNWYLPTFTKIIGNNWTMVLL